jgi:CelD/BcsL family acetyltransferase involved in cellulose biosynthesis
MAFTQIIHINTPNSDGTLAYDECTTQHFAPNPGTTKLRLTVESDFVEGDSARTLWDDTVLRLGGPIYMTYDWIKTWWEFYGVRKQLRVFRFWHGDEPVALLPLHLEEFGFGPLNIAVARLVGANIPPKTFNPPLDAAWAQEILAQVFHHLFQEDRCDLISLGPVSKNWAPAAGLREACTRVPDIPLVVTYQPRDVKTVFHLPATFEACLRMLPSRERSELKRRLRQLENVGVVATEVVSDPAKVEAELETFINHHGRQWRAVGLGGHFTAWPWGRQFHRALVRCQGRLGRVQFHRILVDGRVISNRYTFLWGKTLFSELPSREMGQPWDKLGLGGTAYLKLFEAAIRAGISTVDSGLGQYDNKRHLGGEEVEVGVWRIVHRRWPSRLRAWAFLRLGQVLRLLFHKIWYRRVLPRLPQWAGRSQSLFWLRFDA